MVQPPLSTPITMVDQDGDWDEVRADLNRTGTALVKARLADWRPALRDTEELRRLLGRDWSRYLDLIHPAFRERFAASRALLKYAAAAVVHADPEDLELGYGPSGRPYLRGCDHIDLSLSHTDDVLLVGLTTRGLIGVDVEHGDRVMYGKGLSRHICTPYELVTLADLPEGERNRGLVRLWTLKEAYSKAIGQGMRFPFTEMGFGPDGKPIRVYGPDGTPGTGDEWTFQTFTLDSGYCVSAAVFDAGFYRTSDIHLGTLLDNDCIEAIQAVLNDDVC